MDILALCLRPPCERKQRFAGPAILLKRAQKEAEGLIVTQVLRDITKSRWQARGEEWSSRDIEDGENSNKSVQVSVHLVVAPQCLICRFHQLTDPRTHAGCFLCTIAQRQATMDHSEDKRQLLLLLQEFQLQFHLQRLSEYQTHVKRLWE